MQFNCSPAIVLAAAASIAATSSADFFNGQAVAVNGFAGLSTNPDIQDTAWGTWVDQGIHSLGGFNSYWDNVYGTDLTVGVSSFVNNQYSVSFQFDFSHFVVSDYTYYTIDIFGLKNDGTISGVSTTLGAAGTDGNGVHWEGSGADLNANPIFEMKIYQSPAPGALAILSLAGLAGSRRRRA